MPELELAVDAIRTRFGDQALFSGSRLAAVEAWPTGIGAVDRLSGISGLPRGRLTLLSGRGTCGKLSLALELLARGSRELSQVVAIDPARVFDASELAAHEADLDRVVCVRPPDAAACGEAALALARAGCGMLLLLLPGRLLAGCEHWLPTLEGAASRSGAVLLGVVEETTPALAHSSSLTFGLERLGWVVEAGTPNGLRASVRCLKNRVGGLPGTGSEIKVRYSRGSGEATVVASVAEEAPAWRSAAG